MGNLTLLKYGDPLRAIPPNYSVDVEGVWPPAGWSSWNIGGGNDIIQSSEWAYGGSYSAKIVNATGGVIARFIDSLSIPTSGYRMSAFVRLVSIASDNESAQLFFTGQLTSPYRYQGAMVDRRAGKYYWSFSYYSAGSLRVTTNVEMQLNTDYYVELGSDELPSMWMKVNGVLVASVDAYASAALTYCGIGGYTSSFLGTYTAYVDDIMLHGKILRSSHGAIAVDGSWIHCASYKTSHSSSDGVVKCFRSLDLGVTWNLQQTITITGKNAAPYNIMKYGSALYLVVEHESYTDGHAYHSTVYKSIDNGQSWSSVRDVGEGILFFPSTNITDGTKLAVLLWEVGSSWTLSTIKFIWYDTANDTYSIGSSLATKDDFPLATPSESTLYKSSVGNLVALIRWDENAGADQLFISAQVSTDGGVTWGAKTNLSATWGMIGGNPSVEKIGAHYYLAVYERSGYRHKSKIFEFHPDTYAKIGTDEYPMGNPPVGLDDAGNGSLRMGPTYNQLVHTCDAESSGFYLYEVAGIPGPSGKALLDGFESPLLEGALTR